MALPTLIVIKLFCCCIIQFCLLCVCIGSRGNSGHGVTPDISSYQACNSDKKKRIAFRLGVKTVLKV